ncbi:MAG TPA: RecX family transcriptional regulator [Gaiellaceae bacterium]
MPDQVVLRCGLAAGTTLDRPLLRELRRELRAAEALATASRALAHRDMSRRRLAARLQRAGVAPAPRLGAISALTAAGALDDERLARHRAAVLAERGWGNAAIAVRLESEGVDQAEARAAIDALPPERERAAEAVSGLDTKQAWTQLARRGFDPDTIEAVLGPLDDYPGGGLG